MRSSASILSPPPSPNPTPLPFSSLPSSLTSCPELDLSVTLSPAPKTGHTHMKFRPLRKCPQSDQSELKTSSKGQTRRKKSTQVCLEEPVVVAGTLGKKKPQQPVRTQQRSRKNHHVPIQRVAPPAAASNQEQNSLENVELNTTLALKAELYTLQAAEFNSQRAIEETLQRSERTKNLINSRATDVVNVHRSQLLYNSLVSVDVQEDQLISQVMQDRLLLAPAPQCHGNKVADGPSTLPFMTPDLFRQKPLPPEEEPVENKLRPSTHPAHSTFDLYRRRRRCEASP